MVVWLFVVLVCDKENTTWVLVSELLLGINVSTCVCVLSVYNKAQAQIICDHT